MQARFPRLPIYREAPCTGLDSDLWTDDEEVLLQLSAFSATLSPLYAAGTVS